MKKLVPLLAGFTKVLIKITEKGHAQIANAKNNIKHDCTRFFLINFAKNIFGDLVWAKNFFSRLEKMWNFGSLWCWPGIAGCLGTIGRALRPGTRVSYRESKPWESRNRDIYKRDCPGKNEKRNSEVAEQKARLVPRNSCCLDMLGPCKSPIPC